MEEQTLSIIKPDATKRSITGKINNIIEEAGLIIVAQKRIHLTREQAEKFYSVHAEKPFFKDLVNYMISGPIVVQVLQASNAVSLYRSVMGATNPEEAKSGTIRAEFAKSLEANSVHGSDSDENANIEISFFFKAEEIVG
ncbi:MAG: Nucleoside diphosphate kinase [Alphaproteobacteria bacterium MarineAlpha9_Bin2]|nr:MAG: Nucleoside diphosphate kinase [Alphaproteobacteria bacterium MarineAlpha9_Bin2]